LSKRDYRKGETIFMELLKAIEGIRSPVLDFLVGLITRLGEEELIIVVICIAYWCINKMFAYKTGMIFFLSGLTVQGMKIGFRIPRPWVLDPTFNPVESAMVRATGYSFPSGHTQAGASLFGSLGAQFKQVYLKVIFFAIVFLIGFSRMYLGVHTLMDVAVSIALTLVIVFITYKLFSGDMQCKKRLLAISLFIILYAAGGIIFAFVLDGKEYSMEIGIGSVLVVSRTNRGKYKLFPEETANLLTD